MEKDFLTIYPSTGEDNSVVSVTSEPNTGRQTRTTELTVNAQNTAKSVSVEQLSNLFIEIDGHGRFEEETVSSWIWNTTNYIIFNTDLSAQRITLTGKSNSKYLMLFKTIKDANSKLLYDYLYDVPTTALINGENKNILNEIPDDPGLMQEYAFSIDIDLPQIAKNYIGILTLCVFDGNDRKMISLPIVFHRRSTKTKIVWSLNDNNNITYQTYKSEIINLGRPFLGTTEYGSHILKDVNDNEVGALVWNTTDSSYDKYKDIGAVRALVSYGSGNPVFSEENNPNSLPNEGPYSDNFINKFFYAPNIDIIYNIKINPGVYNIKILPSTSDLLKIGDRDMSKINYNFNNVIKHPSFEWAYNSTKFIEFNNVLINSDGILYMYFSSDLNANNFGPGMNLMEITEA